MNENKMNPNAKLSFLERFAYGIGDYAGNLVYSAGVSQSLCKPSN